VPPHYPTCHHLLPFSSGSTSSFACWPLHALQEVHSVMDTLTLIHLQCVTQISNAPCTEFSAYWNHNRYEATTGAYMDLDDVSF
jgi:hypothetical protein